MKQLKYSRIKSNMLTVVFVVIAMFIMVTPALANSSGWSFLAYYDGRVVNGRTNGAFHTMTAGALTMSGTLKTTAIYGTPAGAQPWYFEVHKNDLFQTTVCTGGPIAVPVGLNQTTNFSKACGNISADSYFLIFYRNAVDNREVTGSGTMKTP